MNKFNELILASAAICALSGVAGVAAGAADTNSDTPTADELKHSKARGLVAVPLPTVPPVTTTKINTGGTKPKDGGITPLKNAPAKKPATTYHSHTSGAVKTNVEPTAHKPHKVVATKAPPVAGPGPSKSLSVPAATNASYTPGGPIVKVWLNKPGTTPHFRSGEKMQVNVSAAKDCNLMIFDFDGRATLTQLFPNQYQQASAVKAGETVAIGGDNSNFDYVATLPNGQKQSQEKIFVYAYPAGESGSAPLSVAMAPSTSVFRSQEMTIDQYRKLVNESQVFFARGIKVVPKSGVAVASAETTPAPNKYELGFVIEK